MFHPTHSITLLLFRATESAKWMLWFVLGFLSWIHPGEALQIKRPTWKQLVQQADWVVYARVSSNEPHKTPGGLPLLRTYLDVHSSWKGTPPRSFFVQTLDTKHPAIRLHAPSIPRFQKQQNVVLFLRKPNATTPPYLVGVFFGVFDVRQKQGKLYVTSRGQLQPRLSLRNFRQTFERTLQRLRPTSRPTPSQTQSRPNPTKSISKKSPTPIPSLPARSATKKRRQHPKPRNPLRP